MCINDSVKRCWWHAYVGDSKWAPVSEFLMTQFWSSWQNRHQHFSSSTSTIHINLVSIIRISVTNVNEKFGIFLHCLNKLVTESIKYITKIENRIFSKYYLQRCWRRNVLKSQRCYGRFWPFWSPPSAINVANIEIQSPKSTNGHQLWVTDITFSNFIVINVNKIHFTSASSFNSIKSISHNRLLCKMNSKRYLGFVFGTSTLPFQYFNGELSSVFCQ